MDVGNKAYYKGSQKGWGAIIRYVGALVPDEMACFVLKKKCVSKIKTSSFSSGTSAATRGEDSPL